MKRYAILIPQYCTTRCIDNSKTVAFLKRAEALGFESAWVQEHLLASAAIIRAMGGNRDS